MVAHANEPTSIDRRPGDIAVLAILSADIIRRCDHRRPDRRRRTLRDGFQQDGSASFRALFNRGFDLRGERRRQMPDVWRAAARTPADLCRRSNSTAKRMLAVLERP